MLYFGHAYWTDQQGRINSVNTKNMFKPNKKILKTVNSTALRFYFSHFQMIGTPITLLLFKNYFGATTYRPPSPAIELKSNPQFPTALNKPAD